MGFGTIVANIMMFIAIIMVTTGVIFVMNIYVQETQESLTEQKNRLVEELRTSITINSINYNSTQLTIYVTNTGTTNLDMNSIDLFIDGIRVSRTQRTTEIEPDTQIGGPTVWNPREMIKIETNTTMTGTVLIRITTPQGAFDQELISI